MRRRSSLLAIGLVLSLTPALSAQDIPEGSVEAVTEFAEGMRLYIDQNYTSALPHFYKARELDPTFVVSLFFAALCEGNLGSGVPRDSLYEIVLENRDRISPYYAERAESQLAKTRGDRLLALEHGREAAHLAPGSKAWYNLAYDLLYMNRPIEARAALLELDPDKEPMKGWFGYFGVLGSSTHLIGDFEAELAVAREARKRFPERRAALVIQARALAALEMRDELEEVFADAKAMPEGTADNSVGAIMTNAAAELKAHGHEEAGGALYARAVAWYEEAGSAAANRADLTWLVTALIGSGRWQDAFDACERQLVVNPDDLWCHSSVATMALKLGDRGRFEAEKAYFEAEAANRGPTFLPYYLSFLEMADGNVEKGVALTEEAMSLGTGFNIWWHKYPGMEDVLAHPAYKEFLRPKG